MNRAIIKLAGKYVTEIIVPRPKVEKTYGQEKQEKIDLGDRIEQTLATAGWKDIENFIIASINNTMLQMMGDTIKNPYQKDQHYLYKGYVMGYSSILRFLGYILWVNRLGSQRVRITQPIIDYLRGYIQGLISIKDTIRDWIVISRRLKQEEDK